MRSALEELDIADPKVLAYIETLHHDIATLDERNRNWETKYEWLLEQYRLAVYRRFAHSSEKDETLDSQAMLFEEAETVAGALSSATSPTVEVQAHARRSAGRTPLDEKLPRVEILHDIPDDEKRCACGHELTRIGEETSERLQVIPEQMYVERHVRPKYACKHCEGSLDEDKPAVRIVDAPEQIIPHSIVTSGLLAFVLVNKFCDHLPFYRQEKRFERIGVHISRQDMSNWAMQAAEGLAPLVRHIKKRILKGPLVQLDETRLQVLKEPGRANTTRSWMWLARGGPPEHPMLLYTYRTSRNREYPQELLEHYRGYVQTDGWEEYDRAFEQMPGIVHVGCWAHARRKFFEASKAGKRLGAAEEGLKYIQRLYQIENKLREHPLEPEEFARQRIEQSQPVLEEFHAWLTDRQCVIVPQSLVGKAISYTLRQWSKLIRYLQAPILRPDNNDAENAIRPFVLGRRNWLFSGSPLGAEASCAIYSIIQTAKANGFDPYTYLHFLFDMIPNLENDEDYAMLLPDNLGIQQITEAVRAKAS